MTGMAKTRCYLRCANRVRSTHNRCRCGQVPWLCHRPQYQLRRHANHSTMKFESVLVGGVKHRHCYPHAMIAIHRTINILILFILFGCEERFADFASSQRADSTDNDARRNYRIVRKPSAASDESYGSRLRIKQLCCCGQGS